MTDIILKWRHLLALLTNAYEQWRYETEDLDASYCCNDPDCCCGQITYRQVLRGDDDA